MYTVKYVKITVNILISYKNVTFFSIFPKSFIYLRSSKWYNLNIKVIEVPDKSVVELID